MSVRTRGYAHRIDVLADAATVWAYLTSTEDLRQWCSPGAYIVAREGGLLRAAVDRRTELEAHIDVFQPPRRLRLIYLPSADLPQSQTAIVEDFMLDDSSGIATVVRLLGSGFPADEEWDPMYLRVRMGWERALPRLKVLVERGSQRGE